MQNAIPRWLVVLPGVLLTLITGVLSGAILLHGLSMLEDPRMQGDGQYMFVFFIGGGCGLWAALPSAIVVGVQLARKPHLYKPLVIALSICLAIGAIAGLVLSSFGGMNGVLWGLFGMGLAVLGLPMAPLSIIWFHHTLPATLPVGLVLLAVVAGVSWRYGREEL